MKRFINREGELDALNRQYDADSASFMVIYGRRRIGKTTLIREFIKDKHALYFLAREESKESCFERFANALAAYTGLNHVRTATYNSWDTLFEIFLQYRTDEKKILIIDELPYIADMNPSFPSILQWVWDEWFQHENIILILCGSLIHMMEKYTLNYSSPLYGRRTGQLKMKQVDFLHYDRFYEKTPYRDLVERYAVTGGVPRYIELFNEDADIYEEINRLILSNDGILYEEPEFLLRREVDEIGSYFSIIKSIASGNHKPGKICADIGIKQTSLPKYMKTLMDLDIIERETPVTENNPEKSKMSLYQIKDNFLRFWFRFIYPELSSLEIGKSDYVLEKIKSNFIDNHVAHVYEYVCRYELWRLNIARQLHFNKIGRWWNSKEEIDIVALDNTGEDIVFAECKYRNQPMDADVFYNLLRKKELVPWKKENRREQFVLFSISGFTEHLHEIARIREDLILVGEDGATPLCDHGGMEMQM